MCKIILSCTKEALKRHVRIKHVIKEKEAKDGVGDGVERTEMELELDAAALRVHPGSTVLPLLLLL